MGSARPSSGSDDGVALIHAIGSFRDPGPRQPWLDKYIFPGSFLQKVTPGKPYNFSYVMVTYLF